MWGRPTPLCFLYSGTVTHDILAGDWRWSIIRGQVVLWIRGSCAGGTSEVRFMEEMSWSFTGYIGALTLSVLGRGKDESKHFLYLYSQFGTHLWMTGWRRFPVMNPLKTPWHSFHLRLTALCLCLPLSPWDAAHEDSLVSSSGNRFWEWELSTCSSLSGFVANCTTFSSCFNSKEFQFDLPYEGGKTRQTRYHPYSHWLFHGWPNMCQDLIPLSGLRFYYWVVFPGLLLPQQQNRLSSHGQTSPLVKLLSSFIAYISW